MAWRELGIHMGKRTLSSGGKKDRCLTWSKLITKWTELRDWICVIGTYDWKLSWAEQLKTRSCCVFSAVRLVPESPKPSPSRLTGPSQRLGSVLCESGGIRYILVQVTITVRRMTIESLVCRSMTGSTPRIHVYNTCNSATHSWMHHISKLATMSIRN